MKPKPVVFFVLIVFLGAGVPAVWGQYSGASRMEAMGGVSVALDGFWSVIQNQAGMTTSTRPVAGVSGTKPFLVPSMNDAVLGIVFPVGNNAFGFTFQQRGNSFFREQSAGLAYAREFGRIVRTGLRFDYIRLSISDGYGRSGGIIFEAGMQVLLSETIVLGTHVVNPVGVKFTGNEDEKPLGRILIGCTFQITDQFLTAIELEKDLEFGISLKTGLEYSLNPLVSIRIGYATLPSPGGGAALPVTSEFSFGTGLNITAFSVDVAGKMHSTLGWTPTVSLNYLIGKKTGEEGS